MKDLLPYIAVIYDTHCIVYYCFRSDLTKKNGTIVVVEYPLTEKMREITRILVAAKKKILTIQRAWDEVLRVASARAVSEMLSKGDVRKDLGIGHSSRAPAILRYKLTKNLNKKIRAFRHEPWFQLEPTFAPSSTDVNAVRDLYKRLAKDPANHARFKPHKDPIPSETDIHLILYSRYQSVPLLTNDTGIYEFDTELVQEGFCERIRSLPGVSP